MQGKASIQNSNQTAAVVRTFVRDWGPANSKRRLKMNQQLRQRGLIGTVRNDRNGDAGKMLGELRDTVDNFIDRHEKSIDEINSQIAALRLSGPNGTRSG